MYSFDLKKKNVLEAAHSLDNYRFNLAQYTALLSNDASVVKRFYRQQAAALGAADIYDFLEVQRSFFFNARPKNAFVYFGLIPWITESIVRLVASGGFVVSSPLQGVGETAERDKKDVDEFIAHDLKDLGLQEKFDKGVYLESGIGDFAYRIYYDPDLSDNPIIDVIEPQNLEVLFDRGTIKEITVKDIKEYTDFSKHKKTIEIETREIYSRVSATKTYDFRHIKITYEFYSDGRRIKSNEDLYLKAKELFGIDNILIELPFKEFPVVFKMNNKVCNLYKGRRGVPDIQGLESTEDALSESISDLIDAIRKGGLKTFVDEQMLPTDLKGNTMEYNAFDKEYNIVKESNIDPTKAIHTTQAKIAYDSYIETAKYLISHAINKVGLSPTTLGITGLESINSSVDSQDAREKPSMRFRNEKHKSWKPTLETLINRWYQYKNWIKTGKVGEDYSDIINVSFPEYTNPSVENVVDVLSRAVAGRIYSIETAVEKRFIQEGLDFAFDDIVGEAARIKGITIEQEMQFLGLTPPPDKNPDGAEFDENQKATEKSEANNTEN